MKMKILLSVLTAGAFLGIGAAAQNLGNYTVSGAEPGDTVYAAFYNESGILIGGSCQVVGDDLTITLPEAAETAARIRTSKVGSEAFSDAHPAAEQTPSATPTVTPEATASPKPSATATPAPTEAPQSFPDVFEKSSDANRALVVVKSVAETLNADGENVYTLNIMYQGKEGSIQINKDVTISAPSMYTSKEGRDASALSEGDVIYCTTTFSRKITGINLIFSPPKNDIVTSDTDYGDNFEKLISENGKVAGQNEWKLAGKGTERYEYAFGMIGEKSGSNFVLYNKKGEEIYDFSLESNTIVYECDTSNKNETSITSIGGVVKSTIPKSAFDDDGNIKEYSDEYTYNYALVRIVNGTVTEVTVYTNYNN